MNVDRAKFLFLTASISATVIAGCSSSKTTVDEGGANDASTAATNDAATTGDDDASMASGDAATTGDDDSSTAVDSAACDNTVVTGANACSTAPDAGADGGAVCLNAGSCNYLAADFVPKVAAGIANCVAAMSGNLSGPCDETLAGSEAIAQCIENAAQTACPDTTVSATCGQICGDAGNADSLAGCIKVEGSLTSAGKGSFTTCMAESDTGGCFSTDAYEQCLRTLAGI